MKFHDQFNDRIGVCFPGYDGCSADTCNAFCSTEVTKRGSFHFDDALVKQHQRPGSSAGKFQAVPDNLPGHVQRDLHLFFVGGNEDSVVQ